MLEIATTLLTPEHAQILSPVFSIGTYAISIFMSVFAIAAVYLIAKGRRFQAKGISQINPRLSASRLLRYLRFR